MLKATTSVPRVARATTAAAVAKLNATAEDEDNEEAAAAEDDGQEEEAAAEADDTEETAAAEDDGGEDDDDGDMNAAVDAETQRISAIVTSEAGMANPTLAHQLAFDTSDGRMSAARAKKVLDAAGPASAQGKGKLNNALKGNGHGLGADGQDPNAGKTTAEKRASARSGYVDGLNKSGRN